MSDFDEERIDIIGQNGPTAEHYLELEKKANDFLVKDSVIQKYEKGGLIDLHSDDPLNTQIGGDHYKSCTIQPVEYIEANNLAFLEGCIVKRVTRHNKPTGKGKQDIEKAIHELELLLKLRYGANND